MSEANKVTDGVREYMREIGRRGGSVRSPRKARVREQAQLAARARWHRRNLLLSKMLAESRAKTA